MTGAAGAGARRRPAAGVDDARINMMPEADYDYDRESGELEIENIEHSIEDHVGHEQVAPAAVTALPATAQPSAANSNAAAEYDYRFDDSIEDSYTVAPVCSPSF